MGLSLAISLPLQHLNIPGYYIMDDKSSLNNKGENMEFQIMNNFIVT